MDRQPVGISFQNNEVYECGATLLALLAHPADDKNDNRRAHIHASLCRHALEFRGIGGLSYYHEFPTEDDRDYLLEARGRLDITRRSNI